MSIEPTGFCWKCGLWIKGGKRNGFSEEASKELFCCKKHKEQYDREQARQIKRGKRAGYGLIGSTH